MLEIQFPVVTTKPLNGIADANSKMTGSVYESISLEGWTHPFQWVSVAYNAPTIDYPNPSTTGIQMNTARSYANVRNHHVAGNVYFDIGTTTAYGMSDGPVALPETYNQAQVYVDWENLKPGTTYQWRARFVTGTGTVFGPNQSFTTAPDTVAPTVPKPAATLRNGVTVVGGVPFRLAWPAGSDNVGGTLQYRPEKRERIGGAWGPWVGAGGWSTATIRNVTQTAGISTQFRVAVKDVAGNVGFSAASSALTAILVEESSKRITYTGTWTKSALAGASGGFARSIDTAGAKAKFSFTGRTLAVVAPRGPNMGKMAVYADAVKVGTIDLYKPAAETSRIVFVKTLAAGAHVIELRRLPTAHPASTGTRVWLDAFITTN